MVKGKFGKIKNYHNYMTMVVHSNNWSFYYLSFFCLSCLPSAFGWQIWWSLFYFALCYFLRVGAVTVLYLCIYLYSRVFSDTYYSIIIYCFQDVHHARILFGMPDILLCPIYAILLLFCMIFFKINYIFLQFTVS